MSMMNRKSLQMVAKNEASKLGKKAFGDRRIQDQDLFQMHRAALFSPSAAEEKWSRSLQVAVIAVSLESW